MKNKDFMCPLCKTLVSIEKQQKMNTINLLKLDCGHVFHLMPLSVYSSIPIN